jgi:hypothetical protein
MPGSREAWERVLAAIEAETRRAETLLATPVEEFPTNDDRDDSSDSAATPSSRGLPADWMLPTSTALPPLEAMPPVPAELSERILALRAEIIRLRDEMAEALRLLPQSQPRSMALATAIETPSYLDRRL